MRFKYLVGKLNKPNLNNRVYTTKEIKSAINSDLIKEKLNTKSLYGEAGTPTDNSAMRQTNIDIGNISHIITDVYVSRGCLYIEGEVLDTIAGRDLIKLYKQGAEINFAIRALGDIVHTKKDISLVKNLNLITFDWIPKSAFKDAKLIWMR